MATILNNPLGIALILLPLSILAKNLFGAGNGIQNNNFKSEYLKRGLFKGVLIYAGIGVLSVMALLSDELSVVIGGSEYGLIEATILIITGATLLYIKDTFVIFGKIFSQETTEDIEYKTKENE